MRQSDVAATCDQLSSLLRSGLPLPISLRELAETSGGKSRKSLRNLANKTEEGHSLSSAMANSGDFDEAAVTLVRAGEETDSLPEMLGEVADVAWHRQRTVEQLRQVVAYPMIVCYVALLLYCLLQGKVTPSVQEALLEMDTLKLPDSTALTFAISDAIAANWSVIVVALGVSGLAGIWLLTGGGAATTLLTRLIQCLPGGSGLLRALDLSRSCRYLASLLSRQAKLPDAMHSAAGIVFDPKWRRCLQDWAARHAKGTPMTELVNTGNAPDRLLASAFAEDAAPAAAFAQLAEVYQRRADYAATRWRTLWQVSASVFMFLVVGTAIVTLFEPLVAILNSVGETVQ